MDISSIRAVYVLVWTFIVCVVSTLCGEFCLSLNGVVIALSSDCRLHFLSGGRHEF